MILTLFHSKLKRKSEEKRIIEIARKISVLLIHCSLLQFPRFTCVIQTELARIANSRPDDFLTLCAYIFQSVLHSFSASLLRKRWFNLYFSPLVAPRDMVLSLAGLTSNSSDQNTIVGESTGGTPFFYCIGILSTEARHAIPNLCVCSEENLHVDAPASVRRPVRLDASGSGPRLCPRCHHRSSFLLESGVLGIEQPRHLLSWPRCSHFSILRGKRSRFESSTPGTRSKLRSHFILHRTTLGPKSATLALE